MAFTSVPFNTALSFIEKEGLCPVFNTWHFNYNLGYYHPSLLWDENLKIVVAEKSVGPWSPTPVFSKLGKPVEAYLSLKSNVANPEPDKFYWWHTPLTTFEDYLDEKTKTSHNKRKHFPTTHTYLKYTDKCDISFEILDFDMERFALVEGRLKTPNHAGVREYIHHPQNGVRQAPSSWLKMAFLKDKGVEVACALLLDDGRSLCLLNIAALRSPFSFGVFVGVELTKWGCSVGRKSFDCGISKDFGCYKNKIFTKSYEVYGK